VQESPTLYSLRKLAQASTVSITPKEQCAPHGSNGCLHRVHTRTRDFQGPNMPSICFLGPTMPSICFVGPNMPSNCFFGPNMPSICFFCICKMDPNSCFCVVGTRQESSQQNPQVSLCSVPLHWVRLSWQKSRPGVQQPVHHSWLLCHARNDGDVQTEVLPRLR
jgi:hypothetical protein